MRKKKRNSPILNPESMKKVLGLKDNEGQALSDFSHVLKNKNSTPKDMDKDDLLE